MKPIMLPTLLCAAALALPASAARLDVRVEGLRNATGQVLVALHSPSSGFPGGWNTAVAMKAVPVTIAGTGVVFDNIPPGTYALIAVHDEDGDGNMTKTWVGLPTEGFGTSNNPTFYGPPRYGSARFEVTGDTSLLVRVVYF